VLTEEAGPRLDSRAVSALFMALDDRFGTFEVAPRPALAF
jgi:hypothetical protein